MKSIFLFILLFFVLAQTNYSQTTTLVGTIPGSFGVSSTGGAVYTIPLDIPSGRNGMKPSISLVYNSQSSGNVLGKGWGISGFSAITRTNSTPYYNGYYDNIDFDNDEYMLDGQHLIKVGENEYRTEIETYSKILKTNNQNGEYFIVYRKDGTIAEYGNSLDSRQIYNTSGCTDNTPLAWHVNEIYDRLGNNIIFTYVQYCQNGEIHPNEIFYTGSTDKNGAKATIGGTRIFFNYIKEINLPYQSFAYYEKGSQKYTSKNSWLLNSIRISSDSKVDKDYIIDYLTEPGSVNDANFISKITLSHPTGLNTATVLNSTTFDWNFYHISYEFKPNYNSYDAFMIPKTNLISLDVYGNNTEISALFFAKINTALPDEPEYVIKIGDSEIPVKGSGLYLNAYDWDSNGDDEIIFTDDDGVKIYDYNKSTSQMELVYLYPYLRKIRTGDFTGDNIADILLISDQQAQVLVGSFDANGVPTYTLSPYYKTLTSKNQIETVADFNSDSKMEILWRDFPDFKFETYSFSENTGFSANPLASAYISTNTGGQSFYFADFNSDGNTDICYLKTTNSITEKHTWFSFGDGFVDPGNTLESNVGSPQFCEDFNNDGRADFASLNFTGSEVIITVNYTQPDGITTAQKSKNSNYPYGLYFDKIETLCTSDADGNGIRDIILAFSEELALKTPHYHIIKVANLVDESLGKDLITRITDGHDVSTHIEYQRFGMGSTLNSVFPLSKFRYKDYVVAESYILGEDNQKWNRTTYSYTNPITHLKGRGFLGYRETQSVSWQNNIFSITNFEVLTKGDLYFHLYPASTSTWSFLSGTQNKLLAETVNTLDVKVASIGDLRYLPVLTKSVSKSWENNEEHSYKGIVIQNQRIDDIDDYGNSRVYEIIMDEWAMEPNPVKYNWKKTINNTFVEPDPENWIIGLPATNKILTFHSKEEETVSEENSVSTTFNYFTDELGKIKLPPLLEYESTTPNSNTNFTTSIWYTYDLFGNIISENVKAINDGSMAERKIEYSYDAASGYESRFLTSNTIKAESVDKDQTTTYTYDPLTSNLLTITDLNKLTTTNEYDDLGRLVKTTHPDGTSNEIITNWASGIIEQTPPPNALYYSLSFKNLNGNNAKWGATLSFFDKYSRNLRTSTQGLNGELTYVDTRYDVLGRISQVSEPYFSNSTPTQWTTYSYDAIGRITDQTLPTTAVIHTDFAGLTTTITNMATGVWKETTVNVTGNTDIVKDPAGGIVNYNYDAASRVVAIYTQEVATKFEYDAAGNQIKISDPDAGITESVYNAYGELVITKDARNNISTFTYDNLGRIKTKKLMPDNEISVYTYEENQTNNGFGQLLNCTKTLAIDGSIIKTANAYDMLSRIINKTESIDGNSYTFVYDYSKTSGMLEAYTYPSNYKIKYEYNSFGYMKNVVENSTSKVLWTATAANARGQLTDFELGNGLHTHKEYDNYGFPSYISTGQRIQFQMYSFDQFTGNLNWKRDVLGNLIENYEYDPVLKENLTSWKVNTDIPVTVQYADNGNIHSKSDITQNGTGLYTYGASAGPHAVTGLTNPTIQYLNNTVSPSVQYNGNNRVKQIEKFVEDLSLTEREKIEYGNNNQRIKSTLSYIYNNTVSSNDFKYYFDNFEIEKLEYKGITKYFHYLVGGDGVFAILQTEGDVSNLNYIHKDYQGSYNVITDANGAKLETLSFDPWGRRRNPTTWSFTNVPTSFLFDRGYTGHEHLDNFGLINMNGRVYDPAIARFLSPDPILQNPGYTQSHNRYSYCLNNPLKYTDPSGYIQKPVGWNDPLPWIPWYGGGAASYANNNWYSKYRTEDQNYVMMGSRAFNNMYGPGASDIASKLISNPSTFNAWRQGLISIDQVRRNGGNSNMGPSAGLVGEPGKSVIENQYGRWEYNEQGIWVQTVIKLNAVTSPSGQGGDLATASFIAGAASLGYDFWQNLAYDGDRYTPTKGPNAGQKTSVWKMNKSGNYATRNGARVPNSANAVSKIRVTNAVKAGGVALNVVGLGFTGYDIYQNGLNTSNGVDFVMGCVAFVPGWGWAVSGAYFLGKAGYEYYFTEP